MERLTKRDKEGAYFPPCFEEPCLGGGCADDNCDYFNKVCQHLAELEDEEERREKGCYWCKEQTDEFGDTHMTASEITVVSRDRFGQRKLPRNFCPVCGRRLKVDFSYDAILEK